MAQRGFGLVEIWQHYLATEIFKGASQKHLKV